MSEIPMENSHAIERVILSSDQDAVGVSATYCAGCNLRAALDSIIWRGCWAVDYSLSIAQQPRLSRSQTEYCLVS